MSASGAVLVCQIHLDGTNLRAYGYIRLVDCFKAVEFLCVILHGYQGLSSHVVQIGEIHNAHTLLIRGKSGHAQVNRFGLQLTDDTIESLRLQPLTQGPDNPQCTEPDPYRSQPASEFHPHRSRRTRTERSPGWLLRSACQESLSRYQLLPLSPLRCSLLLLTQLQWSLPRLLLQWLSAGLLPPQAVTEAAIHAAIDNAAIFFFIIFLLFHIYSSFNE